MSAIADYTEAIRFDLQRANAHYNRGIGYTNLEDRFRATYDFRQVADLYEQQGNTKWYQRAIERLRKLRSE